MSKEKANVVSGDDSRLPADTGSKPLRVELKRQAKGPITRKSILGTIEQELAMVKQWADIRLYSNAAESAAKAEALIELLEVSDCGSAGGHDKGQPPGTHQRLIDRFNWLKENRNRHVNY